MQRRHLIGVLKLLFIVGGILLLLPMLISTGLFKTTSPDKPGIVVSVADVKPGQYRQVEYAGREIWVYRWTEQEQQARQVTDPGQAWSVLIPYEPYRQCRVHLVEKKVSPVRFVEPCFQAGFDVTGRRLKDTGVAQQQDLPRLSFQWQNAQQISIQPGKRTP
jgi:hypothetical protein